LDGLRKPVVAALRGAVLGGEFEIALACHAIVSSDDTQTAVGLPAVQLGLIPAGNGLLRIASRAGLRTAIDLALRGNSLRPGEARAIGLVDEVCHRSILIDVSARAAKALVGRVHRPRERKMASVGLFLEKSAVARAFLFRRARDEVRGKRAVPAGDCAAEAVLDVLECFAKRGFPAAAELEAREFGARAISETAHRLLELGSAIAALDRDSGVNERVEPRRVRRIAVHGGGPLGSGIAQVALAAGASVRLHERDDRAAGAALREVRALLDARVASGELTELESDQRFSEFSATTDLTGLRNADVVIEAAPEDLSLKRAILGDLEALVGPSCILALNTSHLPIAKIAQGVAAPERVVGMHYFNPVPRVPLLEVVRAEKTAPWAVATAVALGKRQGKTVIVVKDGPGFYAARVMTPWLNEALYLLSEGVTVDGIDGSMEDWGFPVGPIRLLDEMGIDAHSQVALELHAAFGARMALPAVLA
ncbi:MAG: 3-hydroxyacyl-CoA dehydrogenase NAD-binding domain-containing protein, partial [Polyangiaceae bacterium]